MKGLTTPLRLVIFAFGLLVGQNLLAYYNPGTGRWLSRDPVEEAGGINMYGIVDNCPVNRIDVLGLRPLSTQEKRSADELKRWGQELIKSHPELAAALKAVVDDYEQMILALPGASNPKQIQITTNALSVWTDSKKSNVYRPKGKTYMCSAYVRRVLHLSDVGNIGEPNAAAFLNRGDAIGAANLRVVYKLEDQDLEANDMSSKIKVDLAIGEFGLYGRLPRMGDVVAYGNSQLMSANSSHIGIYLGHGIFVSSTVTTPPEAAGHGGVMIKFLLNEFDAARDKIIFRTTE